MDGCKIGGLCEFDTECNCIGLRQSVRHILDTDKPHGLRDCRAAVPAVPAVAGCDRLLMHAVIALDTKASRDWLGSIVGVCQQALNQAEQRSGVIYRTGGKQAVLKRCAFLGPAVAGNKSGRSLGCSENGRRRAIEEGETHRLVCARRLAVRCGGRTACTPALVGRGEQVGRREAFVLSSVLAHSCVSPALSKEPEEAEHHPIRASASWGS